jgi:hypothetical protein
MGHYLEAATLGWAFAAHLAIASHFRKLEAAQCRISTAGPRGTR